MKRREFLTSTAGFVGGTAVLATFGPVLRAQETPVSGGTLI